MGAGSTVVVGAGPAGLATAAILGRHGVETVVLERGDDPAESWRGHYESLRLHTVRSLSSLPGAALPRSLGRWVARDDFIAYLGDYASSHRLQIRTGTTVRRIERTPAGFTLATSTGPVEAASVVVATGYTHTPVLPEWPGRERFEGRLLHSREYPITGALRELRREATGIARAVQSR